MWKYMIVLGERDYTYRHDKMWLKRAVKPCCTIKDTTMHWCVKPIYLLILVGGLEHFLFSHILGIIIPID